MSISDKNRALLVLVVVLLVFGSIMAYSLNVESKPEIDVEEGYEEIDLEYVKLGSSAGSTKTATAVTSVNGKNNTLKFEVIPLGITGSHSEEEIYLELRVKGDFKQKYNLENFLFKMQELKGKNTSRNHQDFLTSYVKESNMDSWPSKKNIGGSRGTSQSYIGFDVSENNFSGKVRVAWDIPKANWNNTYTLRLESVVRGMSEDVTATVDVTIRGGVK